METDNELPACASGEILIDQRLLGHRIELFTRALISDAHGRFLLVKPRNRPDGKWEMPGGRVKHGETCTISVVRRLSDDLGILTWPSSIVLLQDKCCSEDRRHQLSITYSVSIISGELLVNESGKVDKARWFAKKEVPREVSREALSAIESRHVASIMVS